MDEFDIAEAQIKDLKESGYRSPEHKRQVQTFNAASQEFERNIAWTFDIEQRRDF